MPGATTAALAQQGYVAGAPVESLSGATVLELALAVVLAGPLAGKRLASSPAARAGQLAQAVVLTSGHAVLARCDLRTATSAG